MSGRVDLAHDRDPDLALLRNAAGDLGHVLRVDSFRSGLDRHADKDDVRAQRSRPASGDHRHLSLIHISEPTRLGMISYAVFCLKKKKKQKNMMSDSIHSITKQDNTKIKMHI